MRLRRRDFLRAGATSAAWMAAVGCDQLPRQLRSLVPTPKGIPSAFDSPGEQFVDPIIHVLNRAAYGSRPGDYGAIKMLSGKVEDAAQAWIEQQLQPEKISDDFTEHAVRRFETLNEPLGELFEYQPELLHDELMRASLFRAVFSERQLFEVMVQFWSDHFNIDPSKGDCRWLKVADDRDVTRKHALGKFPELLRASALSPAMLWYLDGRVNQRRDANEKPNENYARELLELHTLGVHGGYTQKDVMEAARCLTGWTVRSTETKPYFFIGKVEFKPELHDFGSKEILGERLPAWEKNLNKAETEKRALQELDRLLMILTSHPATALHVSTKLCRRLISEDPPKAAVDAVAETFRQTSGDIRETLRTLFRSTEFRSAANRKVKRPFEFIVSTLRATGAETDAGLQIIQYLDRMGHAPFSYPTPEGYPDMAAPWLGTLLWRWNFALALSENKIKGTKVGFEALRKQAGGDTGVIRHLLGRQPTPEEIHEYEQCGAGLALLLASPAFQRC